MGALKQPPLYAGRSGAQLSPYLSACPRLQHKWDQHFRIECEGIAEVWVQVDAIHASAADWPQTDTPVADRTTSRRYSLLGAINVTQSTARHH
jgi:hypothetical protein